MNSAVVGEGRRVRRYGAVVNMLGEVLNRGYSGDIVVLSSIQCVGWEVHMKR